MPELPEVEAAARCLRRWTAGRQVVRVVLADPAVVRRALSTSPRDADPDAAARVAGLRGPVARVLRHGKRLGLVIGETALLAHLGMTGRFALQAVGAPEPPYRKLGLGLDDGATIWFCDSRRFGGFAKAAGPVDAAVREDLGPDALDAGWTGEALRGAIAARGPIKPVLLDQARIAGLGNIHAAEALFRAKISPFLRADRLDAPAGDRLAVAIGAQLHAALDDLAGDEVQYMSDGAHVDNPFAVYGREGLPCLRCGGPVARVAQAGRSTFWCPRCQPAPDA